MIEQNDVMTVDITPDELQACLDNPVEVFTRKGTGQLRAVGDLALMKALRLGADEFSAQIETARGMGVSYICDTGKDSLIGINPTVSLIHDGDVIGKHVIVPACQLYKDPALRDHYTVGVFVEGSTNADGEVVDVTRVQVAGWVQTEKLRRWVTKGGVPPFVVKRASLAVAPCDILTPMRRLIREVRWQKFCV